MVRQAASEGQPGAGTFVGIQAGQREDRGGFLKRYRLLDIEMLDVYMYFLIYIYTISHTHIYIYFSNMHFLILKPAMVGSDHGNKKMFTQVLLWNEFFSSNRGQTFGILKMSKKTWWSLLLGGGSASIYIGVEPKIVGKPPKWMLHKGKPY